MIADLVVPGRDNNLLIARLRRAAAGIPVLYVSGYPRCHAAGLFDFPEHAPFPAKPFELCELLGAIPELLPAGGPGRGVTARILAHITCACAAERTTRRM